MPVSTNVLPRLTDLNLIYSSSFLILRKDEKLTGPRLKLNYIGRNGYQLLSLLIAVLVFLHHNHSNRFFSAKIQTNDPRAL